MPSLFLLVNTREPQSMKAKLVLPKLPIGIVACAFTLLWVNLCRNSCKVHDCGLSKYHDRISLVWLSIFWYYDNIEKSFLSRCACETSNYYIYTSVLIGFLPLGKSIYTIYTIFLRVKISRCCQVVATAIGGVVWSKHHRYLLGNLRLPSAIFGNLRKMFRKCSETFIKPSEQF